MSLQSKVFETVNDFRTRTIALASSAFAAARARQNSAAKAVDSLKLSLGTLQVAGRELNQVARRHVGRFVQENAAIAREAGKEVTALARSTCSKLAKQETVKNRKARKTSTARRRATSRTRVRAAVNAG
jgi:hypothetical protein